MVNLLNEMGEDEEERHHNLQLAEEINNDDDNFTFGLDENCLSGHQESFFGG